MGTFPVLFPDEQKQAVIDRVVALVHGDVTQATALRQAADEFSCSPRSIQRWAKDRGQVLPVADASRQGAVANAAIASHIITVQRQRDLVQILLRVVDGQVTYIEGQARKGAENVDSALLGRIVTKLSELHTLDNALMLQVGRFDASRSREENEREAANRIGSELDEYSAQWERDRQAFGVDDVPPPPSGTEG